MRLRFSFPAVQLMRTLENIGITIKYACAIWYTSTTIRMRFGLFLHNMEAASPPNEPNLYDIARRGKDYEFFGSDQFTDLH